MSGNWTKYEESDKISGVGPNVIGLCKNVPSRAALKGVIRLLQGLQNNKAFNLWN